MTRPLAHVARGALLALVLAVALGPRPVLAVLPDEMLKDPKLEHRAREISKGLRCLVCQNQSIDDSNADLAKDLRVLVRERLKAGDTNEQVVNFVVDRYGEFVLLKPRFEPRTLVLWLGPPLIIAAGLVALFVFYRRRQGPSAVVAPAQPLSEDEKTRLAKLLDDGDST